MGTRSASRPADPITSLAEVPEDGPGRGASPPRTARSGPTTASTSARVFRAFLTNITSGKIEQGGSTITQQLVKNRILTSKRDVNRKIKEIEDALRLNEKFSKEKIFIEYLNTVYFGSGSYGIKAAAQRFFLTVDPGSAFPAASSLDELTIGEAALLAGVDLQPRRATTRSPTPTAPSVAGPTCCGAWSTRATSPRPRPTRPTTSRCPRSRRPRTEQRPRQLPLTEVCRTCSTTDPRLGDHREGAPRQGPQGRAEDLHHVRPAPAGPGRRGDQPIAKPQIGADWVSSLVAIDPGHRCGEGDGVAATTSPSSQYNIATSPDGRQTGSTFKVITLAAALANGYSPEDQSSTAPSRARSRASSPACRPSSTRTTRPTAPRTASTRLDHSTAHSINCAFVRLATSVGLRQGDRHRPRHGHHQGQPRAAPQPHARDARAEHAETMATVMATIANHGVHHTPFVVPEGRRRPTARCSSTRPPTPATRRIPADVADCEANLLRNVITGGTGGNADVAGQEIFGKTGTTDNRPTPGSSAPTPAVRACSSRPRCGSATAPARSAAPASVATPPHRCSSTSWHGRSPDQAPAPLPDPGPGVRAARWRP